MIAVTMALAIAVLALALTLVREKRRNCPARQVADAETELERVAAASEAVVATGRDFEAMFDNLAAIIPGLVDRNPKVRSSRAWALVAAGVAVVALAGVVLGLSNQHATNALNLDRRIQSRGVAYAGCRDDNAQAMAQDGAIQSVFDLSRSPDPARASRLLDNLRSGWTLKDCESVLGDLKGEDRERAKRSADTIPRQPLPPPTLPGYVPAR